MLPLMTTKRPTSVSTAPPPRRYDRPGHLDPAHAARLLKLGRVGRTNDSNRAFVQSSSGEDDFAEELGETAVASMTSGQEALTGELDAQVDEERGGPFIETSGKVEFAGGTDASNIAEATREPIPLANHDDAADNDEEDE
jgi:hypothetical protein